MGEKGGAPERDPIGKGRVGWAPSADEKGGVWSGTMGAGLGVAERTPGGGRAWEAEVLVLTAGSEKGGRTECGQISQQRVMGHGGGLERHPWLGFPETSPGSLAMCGTWAIAAGKPEAGQTPAGLGEVTGQVRWAV